MQCNQSQIIIVLDKGLVLNNLQALIWQMINVWWLYLTGRIWVSLQGLLKGIHYHHVFLLEDINDANDTKDPLVWP